MSSTGAGPPSSAHEIRWSHDIPASATGDLLDIERAPRIDPTAGVGCPASAGVRGASEHNLRNVDVRSDWVIDLGPGGGDRHE